jgi:hypothetical protein
MIASQDISTSCGYMRVPWMSAIPWISGFILAVIPETALFDIKWYWMFLINIPIACICGYVFAVLFLRWFASGLGAGLDVIISLVIGIITLTIGLCL